MADRLNTLEKAAVIARECDRCGNCTTVCPLYAEKDIESSAARGKNNLALGLAAGMLEPSRRMLDAANFCLLCRTCVDNCPTKVETDEVMIALRQHLTDELGGVTLKYKGLGILMKSRTLVRLSAFAMALMRGLGVNGLAPRGLVPSEYTRRRFLSAYAGPALLGAPAAPSPSAIDSSSRVAYFNGCGMQMMFPDAAACSRRLVAQHAPGKLVSVDNRCCGLVHLAHGMRNDFIALAKENIRLYENTDIIVTDCASCSSTLKHTARYFDDDPQWRERAQAFGKKIMDITEFLVKSGHTPQRKTGARLTFHEPCHLGRGQGLRKEPRELLKAAGEYVEMKGADTCCGGSGSFHLDFPEVSDRLLDKKRDNIEQSGAAIVVTECPACLAQMQKAARDSNGRFVAMHISQVL
ncbi:MAG TPA: (Fe-S)-binding protein [Deltaproteobacteria bacterium]|nr:(Fe-S)-binding protein [Deltaproteobacteria bacterium]HQB38081.1 (Fe-S)-binding protein [Deltaproteobacteria bacterium]